MGVLLLNQEEVRRLLDLDALLEALEDGFRAISEGRIDVPPRVAANTESGLLGVMPGYGQGIGLATKLVSVFPGGYGPPDNRPGSQTSMRTTISPARRMQNKMDCMGRLPFQSVFNRKC